MRSPSSSVRRSVTSPTSPPGPTPGRSLTDAGIRALVDLDRLVPEQRVLADHARRLEPVGLEVVVVVELQQLGVVPVLSPLVRELRDLIAQLRGSPCSSCASCDLALNVDENATGNVAHRREHLAGAVLDRRQHLHDPALHRVQRAARRLAEIIREKDQGNDDEQREHRASPSNLLVVQLNISKAPITGLVTPPPVA